MEITFKTEPNKTTARFVDDGQGNMVFRIFEEGYENGLSYEDFERKKRADKNGGESGASSDGDEISLEGNS